MRRQWGMHGCLAVSPLQAASQSRGATGPATNHRCQLPAPARLARHPCSAPVCSPRRRGHHRRVLWNSWLARDARLLRAPRLCEDSAQRQGGPRSLFFPLCQQQNIRIARGALSWLVAAEPSAAALAASPAGECKARPRPRPAAQVRILREMAQKGEIPLRAGAAEFIDAALADGARIAVVAATQSVPEDGLVSSAMFNLGPNRCAPLPRASGTTWAPSASRLALLPPLQPGLRRLPPSGAATPPLPCPPCAPLPRAPAGRSSLKW